MPAKAKPTKLSLIHDLAKSPDLFVAAKLGIDQFSAEIREAIKSGDSAAYQAAQSAAFNWALMLLLTTADMQEYFLNLTEEQLTNRLDRSELAPTEEDAQLQ